MKFKRILLGAAVSLAAVSASAQQFSPALGVEGGWASIDQESRARSNAQLIANASGQTTTYTYDRGTFAGRLFLGMPMSKDFEVELGYFMTGSLDSTYTIAGASATESFTASGFDASFVIKPESFNGLFVKAGMHRSEVEGEASATIGGTRYVITASESGSSWLVGGGYAWQLGNDKDLLARVTYTFYNKLGGMSDGDASVFAFGIMKRF
jgi:hypothetical protein